MATKELLLRIDIPTNTEGIEITQNIKRAVKSMGLTAIIEEAIPERLIWQDGKLFKENGREIHLTHIEREIIEVLADKPNELITYDELELIITARQIAEISSQAHFRVILHRLRKKLGLNQHIIQTERDNGYSLRVSDDTLIIR